MKQHANVNKTKSTQYEARAEAVAVAKKLLGSRAGDIGDFPSTAETVTVVVTKTCQA
jgi:hypothetical protein